MESNGPSTGVKRSVHRGDAMLADKLLLMKKLLIYVLLVVLAVLLAAFYGITVLVMLEVRSHTKLL